MDTIISIFTIIVLLLNFSVKSFAVTDKKINPLKLHIDSIVVDGHNDTMMKIIDETTWLPNIDIRRETQNQIDIPKLRAGNLKVPFFSAYTSAYYGNPNKSVSRTLALINALYWTEKNNADIFEISSTYDEIEKGILAKKIAAVPTMEGAYSLVEDNAMELLGQYHDLGVKVIGFTWNYSNDLGEGAYRAYADRDGTHSSGGLTELGAEVVERMNELGMIVDVSHMAESTFWDVINTTKAPVIASHSGVYAMKAHQRNLNDEQLKALAKNGGVIGIVLYPEFLTDKKETFIKDFVDHIDYAVKLIGVDHVGIGSDFDGATMPKDLKDSSKIYKITEELVRRNYKKEEIQKILGKNFLRVIKECDKLAEVPNKASNIRIEPFLEMGEIIKDGTPLLKAKIEGNEIDQAGFRIIINGIVHNPTFDKETSTLSYKIKNPLIEKFYVVTFEAKNTDGEIQRESRIFYNCEL